MVAGLSVLSTLLTIPVPLVAQYVLDEAVPSERAGRVFWAGTILVVLLIVNEVIVHIRRLVVARHGKAAVASMRKAMVNKLHQVHIDYHRRNDPGQIHERIVYDTAAVDTMTQELLATIAPTVILAAGMAGVLLSIHWLAFVEALLVAPSVFLVYRFFRPRLDRAQQGRDAAFSAFAERTSFSLRSIELARTRGTEAADIASNAELVEAAEQTDRAIRTIRGLYRGAERAVLALFTTAILVTLGIALVNTEITVGEMFAFFLGIAILAIPAAMTLSALPSVNEGVAALDRVTEFLDIQEERPYSGTEVLDSIGTISLDNVSFSYGAEALLSGVDAALVPGSVTMISGPNGSGKSSIISLILGLFRPDAGALTIDGTGYERLNMTALRGKIGLVSQDPIIVSGTIAENIKYGVPDASDAELWQAAHLATVDDFIVDFDGGYEHLLGFEGRTLSGGQRQRIAIARALIRAPQLLILDEPTSHLDTGTLRRIINNISRLPKQPTVLITSHHPRAIDSIDVLYRIEGRQLIKEPDLGVPDDADSATPSP